MKNKFIYASLIAIILVGIVIFYSNGNISINSDNLKRFNSYEELVSYVGESSRTNSNYGDSRGLKASLGAGELASSSAPNADSQFSVSGSDYSGTTGGDYSGTNIQVLGVDELDTVKTDGKYIYTVNQNKVIITLVYPADSMKIVSEIKFDNYINGLFFEDNKLIVIESSYGDYNYGDLPTSVVLPKNSIVSSGGSGGIPDSTIMGSNEPSSDREFAPSNSIVAPERVGYGTSGVNIYVYDVEDNLVLDPKLLETFSLEGNYYTARLVDGVVYLISNKYLDNSNPVMPYFKVGAEIKNVEASDIYYPGYSDSNLLFTSVMAIDISSLDYKGDVFITGSSSAIYVSDKSIYLTSPKSYDYSEIYYEIDLKVIVESLAGEYKLEAQNVLDSNDEYYVKSNEINLIMQEYFNKLSVDEKKDFEESFNELSKDYYSELSKKYEKTLIHKIDINGLEISYSGSSEVQGYVLNQFSMDEFNGNFRIATTTGNLFGNFESSSNSVYVLDKDLQIIGEITDIAPGERIYSARFLGEKAYMVTFRQVDPLYAIDLSEPKNPKVMGYLKVTGFSNYLHPIGDNLLLGIGREATDEGRQEGLKISLFDVSDFSNPKEIDSYVVDSDWSYSEAEYEHKAVLFDDKRDLLVLPVTYSQQLGDKWEYWQGAFVFAVTETDISLKGKIDHKKQQKLNEGSISDVYYDFGYIQRSLFIEDFLYTVSNYMIKANAISDLKELGEVDFSFVELPTQEPRYYDY